MRTRILPGAVAGALLTAALSAGALAPATAATTVSPSEPGAVPVVRDSDVQLAVDRTAMTYYRGSGSAAFAPQIPLGSTNTFTACRGDLPTGVNNSPRTTVSVTGPDGGTVVERTSPVRDLSTASFFAAAPRHRPVDAAPSATNYRGDFPDSGSFHGMTVDLDLEGRPAGTYTVTTTDINKVKTGLLGACSTGTPVSNGSGGFTAGAPTPGPKVTTTTFEYRPWQATFTDVLGAGRVAANTTPAEFTFSIGSKTSRVHAGGPGRQTFYALPDGGLALPSDPTQCAEDAASCLPPTAVPCDPASGCTPRAMVVNKPQAGTDTDSLIGVFDLETKAFVAHAQIGRTSRVLFSLGTDNDSIYDDVLQQLAEGAAAQGIDLPAILGTEITLGDGRNETSLSLLNGLQIDPSTRPGGVQITTSGTAQAGIILHVYGSLRLDGGACTESSGSSQTGRYTPTEADGYTVRTSDILPAVPAVGPLAPLTGGPIWSIRSRPEQDALVNVASAALGVDTAGGEPNGYPIWLQPFVSGVNTAEPKSLDFLGTGTWSSSQTPVGSGCLVTNGLLGTGVAVYDNPLPVGLGTLADPLTQPSPQTKALTDVVAEVVDQAVAPLTSNETVDALLESLVGALELS